MTVSRYPERVKKTVRGDCIDCLYCALTQRFGRKPKWWCARYGHSLRLQRDRRCFTPVKDNKKAHEYGYSENL